MIPSTEPDSETESERRGNVEYNEKEQETENESGLKLWAELSWTELVKLYNLSSLFSSLS